MTKVEQALLPYKEFDTLIRNHHNGYIIRWMKLNLNGTSSLVYVRVRGITWRGSINSPIICFLTIDGGLIDVKYFTIL